MAAPRPEDYDAAVAWFRERVPMSDDEFAELEDDVGDEAFTLAGVNQLQLVADVWNALDDAIAEGTSFDDFKAEVGEQLADAWAGADAYRVETIFRTWVQRAYGAGRYEMMTNPDVKQARPFWQFMAILDGRTSNVCADSNDTVLPADHPWWARHNPPLHFSCRSTVVTLTPEEAAGKADDPPPDAEADEGFGAPPTVPFNPDLSRYPPQLVNALQEREDSDEEE